MGVTRRLWGFSVQCDTCGHGAFLATPELNNALVEYGLMINGYDEEGEYTLKCANGCRSVLDE